MFTWLSSQSVSPSSNMFLIHWPDQGCLLMFLEDNFSDQSSYFDMNVLFYLALVDWYVVNVDVQEAWFISIDCQLVISSHPNLRQSNIQSDLQWEKVLSECYPKWKYALSCILLFSCNGDSFSIMLKPTFQGHQLWIIV